MRRLSLAVIAALLLPTVAALSVNERKDSEEEKQWPFFNPFQSEVSLPGLQNDSPKKTEEVQETTFGAKVVYAADVDADCAQPDDDRFFEKQLADLVKDHPEKGSAPKIKSKKGKKFIALNYPWNPEANRLSLKEKLPSPRTLELSRHQVDNKVAQPGGDTSETSALRRQLIRSRKSWKGTWHADKARIASEKAKKEEEIELGKQRAEASIQREKDKEQSRQRAKVEAAENEQRGLQRQDADLSRREAALRAIETPEQTQARRKPKIEALIAERRQEVKDEKKEFERAREEAEARRASMPDVNLDIWYFNMNGASERQQCLEHQFADMSENPPLKRFEAVKFPDCIPSRPEGLLAGERISDEDEINMRKSFETCLMQKGFGDCIEGGVDYDSTKTHGSEHHDQWTIRSAVLSRWCSSKRLWQDLTRRAKSSYSFTRPAEYLVFLEDDVILDREYFMRVVQDFASSYENRNWDLVQIDPFGKQAESDVLGKFRGKPIFKPAMGKCSQYWGFHAVLLKRSALERVSYWMSNNKAVPIDWLPWTMPHCLSFAGLVSRNPEAMLKGGEEFLLPAYCSDKVKETTIG